MIRPSVKIAGRVNSMVWNHVDLLSSLHFQVHDQLSPNPDSSRVIKLIIHTLDVVDFCAHESKGGKPRQIL